MLKYGFIFLLLALQGCSNQFFNHDNPDAHYFSDATDCFQITDRKQNTDIKGVGIPVINVDIPLGSDAGAFRQCMEYKGHTVTAAKANTEDYLNVSRGCLYEARASSNADETYANCVKLGTISVEPISPKK